MTLLTFAGTIRLLVLGALQLVACLVLSIAPIMVVGIAAIVLTPVILVPWFVVVFRVLLRPTQGSLLLFRIANLFGVGVGIGLLGLGWHMLDAEEKSARAGGGLLGGLGYYPMGAGVLLVILCALSLALAWGMKPAQAVAA